MGKNIHQRPQCLQTIDRSPIDVKSKNTVTFLKLDLLQIKNKSEAELRWHTENETGNEISKNVNTATEIKMPGNKYTWKTDFYF